MFSTYILVSVGKKIKNLNICGEHKVSRKELYRCITVLRVFRLCNMRTNRLYLKTVPLEKTWIFCLINLFLFHNSLRAYHNNDNSFYGGGFFRTAWPDRHLAPAVRQFNSLTHPPVMLARDFVGYPTTRSTVIHRTWHVVCSLSSTISRE